MLDRVGWPEEFIAKKTLDTSLEWLIEHLLTRHVMLMIQRLTFTAFHSNLPSLCLRRIAPWAAQLDRAGPSSLDRLQDRARGRTQCRMLDRVGWPVEFIAKKIFDTSLECSIEHLLTRPMRLIQRLTFTAPHSNFPSLCLFT